MNGTEIISYILQGQTYHRLRGVVYMICGGDTLVILSSERIDCGIVDKILQEHCFRYKVWVSFTDDNRRIDELNNEVNRLEGKTFKITEYHYLLSSIGEDDIPLLKNAIIGISNGELHNNVCNPIITKPLVRLCTKYRLSVKDANGVEHKVKGEFYDIERAKDVAYNLYKNHSEKEYEVYLATILRFPTAYGEVAEHQFMSYIERITENKTYKNMKKNVQRIDESQLRAIVAESVKKVLNENGYDDNPPSGYEIFSDWGARAAYAIMREIEQKRGNYVEDLFDEQAIYNMVSEFEDTLRKLIINGEKDEDTGQYWMKPYNKSKIERFRPL